MRFPKGVARLAILVLGIAFVTSAIGVSNDGYPRLLGIAPAKDLSWGPMLFRGLLILHGSLLVVLGLRRKPNSFPPVVRPTGADTSSRSVTPLEIGVLAGLSVLALLLRLWKLNSDLWIDEVLTLLDFVRRPIGEIVTSFPSQNQHMLFSILARASTAAFGESAWSLRLPSVIFGVASIWAFFFLCKSLVGSKEALLGGVLMTVSYHHIWFSQNARGYMGLLLFTMLATWLWFKGLETNEWTWWLAYVGAVVLGMWVHPTMAFVVAAHGVVHIAFLIWPRGMRTAGTGSPERRAGFRPFAAWLLSISVTLQLYALALPEFLSVGLHEESKASEWTNPLWVVAESMQSLRIGFAGSLILIFGAAFLIFGWTRLFRLDRRAGILMVLPAIFAGGTMVVLGHNIWPRFFFFSMGFGLLTVIYGAVELPKLADGLLKQLSSRTSIISFAGVGACLLVIVASAATLPKNYALPKQNFSAAKSYVEDRLALGDGIVAVSLAGVVYGAYLEPHWPAASTADELESIQQGRQRIWLVYTIPIEVKAFRPDVWKMIENDYEVVQVFPGTLNGGEVVVCQRKLN